MQTNDDELRARFAQVRDADREREPAFAHTLGRARTRRSARVRRVRPLVLAATAAVSIAAVWLANARPLSSPAVTVPLADWRAPTDVFLHTPGTDVLGAMPALGTSVLDRMLPAPTLKGA